MWEYIPYDELYHHGIKGMQWGVRRSQSTLDRLAGRVNNTKEKEKAYRNKLTAITSRENINESDRKRFEYRNQSLAARTAKTATRIIAGRLIADVMTGSIKNYGSMSKADIAKELTSIAASTAANVALSDALAKSAAKNYTNDGKRVKGKKDNRLITKEDVIETSVGMATYMAPAAALIANMKISQARAKKAENEAKFRSWGGNILTEKVSNIITISDNDWKVVN